MTYSYYFNYVITFEEFISWILLGVISFGFNFSFKDFLYIQALNNLHYYFFF